MFLDDGLVVVSTEQQAMETSKLVQSTLTNAGFAAHTVKSQWYQYRD